MPCSRCGNDGHTEYAPDGQAYCSACLFYGMNRPCWKCRMYLPMGELQTYRGQWTCQYCIMDLRDEERASEAGHKKSRSGRSEEEHLDHIPDDERCDRCRRKMAIVYIFNNRKFCEICIKHEKDEWEEKKGGPGATPTIVSFKLKGNEGLLSSIMRKLNIAIGEVLYRNKTKKSSQIVKKENKDEKSEIKTEEKKPEQKKKHDLEFENYFDDKESKKAD